MEIKILIVEDEVLIANDLKSKLKKLDYQVVDIVYNSDQVTDKISHHQPDLLLLDINIDGSRNGIELAHIINRDHKIPFIFVTSYADQQTIIEVQETNPAGYIVKPFDFNDLKVGIQMALYRLQQNGSPNIQTRDKINLVLDQKISPKEYEIICDIQLGLSAPEIAQKHFVSYNTIKSHIKRIYSKCAVHNRVELVNFLNTN